MVEERGTKPCDSMQDISVLSTQRKLDLSSWGLPVNILKNYEMSGIVSMFPWQVECLSNPRVLEGGNLIYSAPTSAGKTLVAEILTIKTILERRKKVIIILPFVSVVREKMFYFQGLLSSSGVRVEGLMGSHSLPGGFKSVDIAICTIEKANSLINRLLEERSLHMVGAVVVDELHLLGDPFRGYLLELLLTKILYMCSVEDSVKIQVVGMSATIPNLTLLASWLGADLYRTDFRPVPLKEFLKVGPSVYDSRLNKLYDMQASKYIQDDPDHIVQLCLETLTNGHSVLVFCATKNWCEKLAEHVAKLFRTIGLSRSEFGQQLREQLDSNAIAEALGQLQRCPVGLDKVLRCTVAFGVAFHHAGLTVDERDILEGCFRSGAVRVLVATSTLSSGVNLPARRVIVRSPIFHGKSLDSQTYRQMIGRAGRMGRDTEGESFLVCNKTEGRVGEKLIGTDLKPIESCLGHGELAASLKRAILEVIASGVACSPQQVTRYTNCTLLAATNCNLQNPISACVQFLEANELIRLQKAEDGGEHKYVPTPLGLACLAASLPPDEGLLLFDELQRARQCFVLDTELHIIYEVTPYSVCSQWLNLDWLHVLSLWEQLSPAMRKVGELVGIDERFMVRAMRGTLSLTTSKQDMVQSVFHSSTLKRWRSTESQHFHSAA